MTRKTVQLPWPYDRPAEERCTDAVALGFAKDFVEEARELLGGFHEDHPSEISALREAIHRLECNSICYADSDPCRVCLLYHEILWVMDHPALGVEIVWRYHTSRVAPVRGDVIPQANLRADYRPENGLSHQQHHVKLFYNYGGYGVVLETAAAGSHFVGGSNFIRGRQLHKAILCDYADEIDLLRKEKATLKDEIRVKNGIIEKLHQQIDMMANEYKQHSAVQAAPSVKRGPVIRCQGDEDGDVG